MYALLCTVLKYLTSTVKGVYGDMYGVAHVCFMSMYISRTRSSGVIQGIDGPNRTSAAHECQMYLRVRDDRLMSHDSCRHASLRRLFHYSIILVFPQDCGCTIG